MYASWDYWGLYHPVTFDGVLKTVTVNPEVTSLDIRGDVYSSWVEWQKLETNTGFLPTIRYTGLDIIPGGLTGDSYFLINGWKLLVDLSNVAVRGVLFSDDYSSAYYTPTGKIQFPATVSSLVSTVIVRENVVTGDLSSIVIPSVEQTAAAVWAKAVEGLSAEEMLRVMLAALAGTRQGLGTSTEQYMGRDGVTPRITLTPTDQHGNGTPTINGSV